MTIWRVGLRVRKVRSGTGTNEIPIGTTGVITATSAKSCPRCGEVWHALVSFAFIVAYDGFVNKTCGCNSFRGSKDWLEPIQPEGNKVVSWEQCLWNPSMLEDTNKTKEAVKAF